MRFGSWYRQSQKADEQPLLPQLAGMQSEAVLAKMIFNTINQEIGPRVDERQPGMNSTTRVSE